MDEFDEEQEDLDIDEIQSQKTTLLEYNYAYDEEADASQFDLWTSFKSSSGLGSLLKKKKREKGICPLCRAAVTSGAHVCTFTEWRIREEEKWEAVRYEGNAHFRAGRYEAAVAAYSQALEHSPHDPKLLSNRAAAYTALGEPKKAFEDSDAVIRLAPSWCKGYFRKAHLHKSAGDWSAAANVYELALQHCSHAEDKKQAKRFLGAARARAQIRDRVQSFPESLSKTVLEALWKERVEAGKHVVENAAECERRLKQAEAEKAEGNTEVSRKAWVVAQECYTRALRLIDFCPPEPSEELVRLEVALLLNQALCEGQAGRHEAAAKVCNEILRIDPRNVKARFRRASALGEIQDYDAALEDLEIALACQSGDRGVLSLRQKLMAKRQQARKKEQTQFARMLSVA